MHAFMYLPRLKDNHKKHPSLHTMCRFLHLFDEKQEAEEKLEFNETEVKTSNETGKAEVAINPTAAAAAAAAASAAATAAAASATPSQKYAVENTSLPLPVLSVYLFARGCLLHEPYEVIYILVIVIVIVIVIFTTIIVTENENPSII